MVRFGLGWGDDGNGDGEDSSLEKRRMFDAFKSRWAIPRSWRKETAEKIWERKYLHSRIDNTGESDLDEAEAEGEGEGEGEGEREGEEMRRFRRRTNDWRSPPTHSSMERPIRSSETRNDS